jgi:oligosaccharyltransferase complex subunit delta (ribophorin II)
MMRTVICVMVLLSVATVCMSANVSDEPVPVDTGRVREMSELRARYGPKPEIRHLFREPEKRPPTLVSDAFTVLVILPLILLIGLWIAIGVNLSGFSFGIANIGFHTGTALILSLMVSAFWKNMDMFLILKCLSGVLLITFLSGHYLLKGFAKRRQLEL